MNNTIIHDAIQGHRGPDQQRIANEALAWTELLLRKNADYGSSAWIAPILAQHCEPGTAILVRMSDKIQRLASLASHKDAHVHAESFDDTVRDLGAYCLLYLTRPTPKP